MIKQKILGCLYGQAIGDAMGMPSELWTQNRVRSFFGEITTFLPGPKENLAASTFASGEFTDDTQQAIALINAIIEANGDIVPHIIAKHILAWAEIQRAFELNILGPTSKAALLAIREGIPIEQIVANGVTNGAAMRISPIGCLLPTHDKAQFIADVAASCSVTHKSDIAIAGAVVVAWAISRAIEGDNWQTIKRELPLLAKEVQVQFESTFSPSLGRRIELALAMAPNLVAKSKNFILSEIYQVIGSGMDVIETIPAALLIVDIADGDPLDAANYCANLGGDTDTIGAIATAICGALKGINAFPQAMIDTINVANNMDFFKMSNQLAQFRLKRK